MCDHIINIHPNELLQTKTKEFRINEHKKIIKKWTIYIFLPNNILTKHFK